MHRALHYESLDERKGECSESGKMTECVHKKHMKV